ncbi:type VI secretion system baseplate subunit TssK [Pseudoduganella lutea]|uniref:Type VI secretion system baseplate subunit TssK n=1 Tax=Pseudoduganella lutea TaxID=321985 RepID=A0A4P6L6X0_9BURK|nr:type VI secretion system baseplate subunit TssK [Pseudoduganella lutea]QBE66698.1 type VI secretion system baseplate subunit TssK [Pseudoduganella lutea]
MSWNRKVVWSEGMLLQPQHLQQHDRYLHSVIEARVAGVRAYSWGFSSLVIDEGLLAQGKLALPSCSAVLPDGTTLVLPQDDMLPMPLHIPEDARDMLVVLALPVRRPGIAETSDSPESRADPENFARYQAVEYEAMDSNGLDNAALMQVGSLRLRLALARDVANGWTTLGVARVIERRPDNRVVLDAAYCPPCLDYRAAPRLGAFADELVGLLGQRAQALASRLSQPGVGGAAEIADFLMLQLLNRSLPLFTHLAGMTGLHPEALYTEVARLAGELATFSRPDKLANGYPTYRHDRLAESFQPLMDDVRTALSQVIDPHAVALKLEERQFGLRVAVVPDPELLRSATFVLAVNAQVPPEAVRTGFPAMVKIGSVEKIRDLVNLQLPGIALRALPVAPRQLPFHAGYTYFELDRNSEYWRPLLTSAGFAMHVPNEYPGLQMEFWAIRK